MESRLERDDSFSTKSHQTVGQVGSDYVGYTFQYS